MTPRHILIVCEGEDTAGLMAPGRIHGSGPPIVHRLDCPDHGPLGWFEGQWNGEDPNKCYSLRAASPLCYQRAGFVCDALSLLWFGKPTGELAVARVLAVLIEALESVEPRGTSYISTPAVEIEWESSEHDSWAVALVVHHDGVCWRLPLPEERPGYADRHLVAWALATVFCSHVPGYRVEVTP